MTLNRTIQPSVSELNKFDIPEAQEFVLKNGLKIHTINAGEDEVVRLEIIFPCGSYDATSYMMSMAAHYLSDAGTTGKSASEIAEGFDYFGSFYQSEFSADFRSFTLYSINRFFKDTLPLFLEVVSESSFPESEVESWVQRSLQSLSVNREKVAWLSRTAFSKTLFGENHPYGFTPGDNDYSKINAPDLRNFYKTCHPLGNATIILSGKITDAILRDIEEIIPTIQEASRQPLSVPDLAPFSSKSRRIHIPKDKSVQSGIRIGRRMISKNHPDYLPMTIVNTLLGGYFGSRLMSNIREDKGYTYGIGSAVTPMLKSGSFVIATEVGNDVCSKAIDEIYFELNRLMTETVPSEELNLVKSYLSGVFLRNLDGPFAISDRFKGLKLFDLDYDFLKNYMDLLNDFQPDQVQDLAKKYLDPDQMIEVIAG